MVTLLRDLSVIFPCTCKISEYKSTTNARCNISSVSRMDIVPNPYDFRGYGLTALCNVDTVPLGIRGLVHTSLSPVASSSSMPRLFVIFLSFPAMYMTRSHRANRGARCWPQPPRILARQRLRLPLPRNQRQSPQRA